MNIYFSPQLAINPDERISLEVSGDNLIVNGVTHNLADLAALSGDQGLPGFIVAATADNVTVLLPYWGDPSAAVAFPSPIIDVPDGPVELPQ